MAWKRTVEHDESWRGYLTAEEEQEIKKLDKDRAKLKADLQALNAKAAPMKEAFNRLRMRGSQRESLARRAKG